MFQKLGFTILYVGLLIFILFVGQLFLLKIEVQGAFDRSLKIAVDQSIYYEQPDLPINSSEAASTFTYFLAQNLNLDSSLRSLNDKTGLRLISIEEINVLNVYESTQVNVTNPLTGEMLNVTVDRPSMMVFAHADVFIPYSSRSFRVPFFAVSSAYNPE